MVGGSTLTGATCCAAEAAATTTNALIIVASAQPAATDARMFLIDIFMVPPSDCLPGNGIPDAAVAKTSSYRLQTARRQVGRYLGS
jgi:hypothetical protein